MDHYAFITGNQLKEILKEVPENREMQVLTYDFGSDRHYSAKMEMVNKEDICELGERAPSIIFTGNEYFSQLNVYSVRQDDLYNIRPEGVLRVIMLGFGAHRLPQITY